MAGSRVLVIGLDGYEQSFADKMMQTGELPALAELKRKSAWWLLDHGSATRTGLAWEHFSTGLSPRDAGRYSPVYFDPETYRVWQQGTSLQPFVGAFSGRTVVFDPPYFNLQSLQNTRGVVNWGAHDPGVHTRSKPDSLLTEIEKKFGTYPAKDWIYGITWQSVDKTREMSDRLTAGIRKREQISRWLLGERITDWDLGIVVVGELHSAAEGFWHGVDPRHPIYNHPSAEIAGEGLREIYRATDRFVENMIRAFPDVKLVVFSMGGMGDNRSDVPSMCLLPELLYRRSFGRPLMQQRHDWDVNSSQAPLLKADEDWHKTLRNQIPAPPINNNDGQLWKKVINSMKKPFFAGKKSQDNSTFVMNMEWMPVMRYAFAWPEMESFAIPAFYDGRIRINLAGREKHGIVPENEYSECLQRLQQFLLECRGSDGQPVVKKFEPYEGDPLTIHPSGADLVVVWSSASLAIMHPDTGRIGPLPYRRTGGHTGPYGIAYISGAGISAGERGVRSAFDVTPTVLQMLDASPPGKISGRSLLSPAA